MRYFFSTAVVILILCWFIPASTPAQSYNMFNERDDQYRLLGLKRAKEAFEVARSDFERQKILFEKDLITQAELDRARGIFSDTEVNYQQSLLAVLFEKQYISVTKAVKYHDDNGTRHVRLTLANTSGGSEEFRKLLNIDDALFRSLQPDIIHNTYVSLLNDNDAIVSQPYEMKVSGLRYGEPQEVDFTLLQDLDAVTVFLIYGSGTQRSMKIFLQKDASVNRVAVQSEQFSQEVELGESANFGLTLELYSGVNNTFSLEVVNLPREVSHYFSNTAGNVRLRQIKFTESGRTKEASLKVTLPDRSDDKITMDEAIPFYVLVIPDNKRKQIHDLHSRAWTETELKALDIGYTKLELIPRGKGKLNVTARQLYHSILADESVEITIELLNEGSRRLDQIEIKADPPLNWTREIVPSNISSLEINEEARVTLRFTPPDDVAVGKYEVRIQTSALTSGQPITGTDKAATIEIRPKTNLIGTILIVFFIVAIVGGVIFYGIKLSRK